MNAHNGYPRLIALLAILIFALISAATAKGQPASPPRVREYYIAAEEVEWDFGPSGLDLMHGEFIPFPWGLHRKWTKTRYIEYTDGSFSHRKPQPEWLGILGPIIRAEVGDTVIVHFHNMARGYHSIHVHGLRYDKKNEGAVYSNNPGAAVPPGGNFTYKWIADAGSAPPTGESSRLWLYHGHVNEPAETNSGLIGPVIVTARGSAKPDGTPKDVDREFIALFMIFDQLKDSEGSRDTEEGQFHAINGYIFGNLSGLVMNEGERVRWYLAAMGGEQDVHSAHWHGKTVMHHGRYEDVIPLMPAQTETVTMLADNPGIWMFQCHVADHIDSGMMMLYRIRPAQPRSCPVQFGDAGFWPGKPSFEMELQNPTSKSITRVTIESDAVIGLDHLSKVPADWTVPLPIHPGQTVKLEMPNRMALSQNILGWVVFPSSLTFADGSQWLPTERGECRKIYWRDKDHQEMEILPPVAMP